jgi:hypothetical protein
MPPTPWTTTAVARVTEQPATLAGLTAAVRIADNVAGLLAQPDGPCDPTDRRVRGECADARACLEAAARRPLPQRLGLDPGPGPGAPTDPRTLELVLAGCIDLAADVLDNEEEPLTPHQVMAIGEAIAHLDGARRRRWEAAS